MEELLTTRQVIDLLKIDRITVYRMLQDGRLKGVKIGQQWRFPRSSVENLLSSGSPAVEPSPNLDLVSLFPTHCIQTVQDLFAEVSGIGALIIDLQGNPLTEYSNSCGLCQVMRQSEAGAQACINSWKQFAREAAAGNTLLTCQTGLNYLAHPIMDNNQIIGWFLIGGFFWQTGDNRDWVTHIRSIFQLYNLPEKAMQYATDSIVVVHSEDRNRIAAWPAIAARAVQSILRERTGFIERLQQIANLTQIS
ncbi:MAG: PocR ligand-binding domain-containing protein [Bellilinea sp.]|jgi:excisionase family DNA binding protein